MNPLLNTLQPYPSEKLRQLFEGIQSVDLEPIHFGIGEPKHPTPECIQSALIRAVQDRTHAAVYPSTESMPELRQAIASWLQTRYQLLKLDAQTEVLPVAGTREALFALAQIVVDSKKIGSYVVCPNPFYQIYEGAALLSGVQPYFVNANAQRNFICEYQKVPEAVWAHTQLLYVCTPNNPTGAVLSLADWEYLFECSERYGFVIAADECYSEIYFNEEQPPLGVLQAANQLNRGFERLVVFSSLSKRSNVPGLRSGFVAGDAHILKVFRQYRAYHGVTLSPMIQAASIAAWQDEAHVRENRVEYGKKFQAVLPLLNTVLEVHPPEAGFYLWVNVETLGVDDTQFARYLFTKYNVTVLPGSYLARQMHGVNPGRGYIRIALVAPINACIEGIRRIVDCCQVIKTELVKIF